MPSVLWFGCSFGMDVGTYINIDPREIGPCGSSASVHNHSLRVVELLEAEDRLNTAFNAPMILLHNIVQVLTTPNLTGFYHR